jgi:hypothetical protein
MRGAEGGGSARGLFSGEVHWRPAASETADHDGGSTVELFSRIDMALGRAVRRVDGQGGNPVREGGRCLDG